MAWTRTGTISLTNGQIKVYGSGTPWVSNGKTRPGDALLAPDGKVYEIASIESNTELTLTDAYLGATASGQAYKIQHLGLLPAELAVGISDLQSKYLTTIAQLYEWETSEAATVPITNPATGVTVNVKPLKRFLSALGDGSMAGAFTTLLTTGNIGVGASPSDWVGFSAIEQVGGGSLFANSTQIGVAQNCYISGSGWKYKGDGAATFSLQTAGAHSLYCAPSGTAGSSAPLAASLRNDASSLTPGTDNAQTIGSGSLRWSTVYAGTGSINTSDAREKTAVIEMTADEINAARQLAHEIGIYKFLSAVAEKGDQARKHVGMTVQRAIEIMAANGLDPMAYGFICHDVWTRKTIDHPAVDGHEAWTEVVHEAGDRYSFRTDELNLFIARGFEARLSLLEAANG